jgi:Cof subfamily protein (haloacid dehalogenase superfamily)
MSYKCIALDLDDTLLNAKKEVTPETLRMLGRAAEAGIRIVLASGRSLEGMQFVLNQIPGHSYTISAGGAAITDKQGQEVYSCSVPSQTAKSIMQYAQDRGFYFQIFCNNTFYYTKRTQYTEEYEESVRFKGTYDPGILEWESVYTSKILIIDSQEKIDTLRAVLEKLYTDVKIVYSQYGYMEILNKQVSKGNALKLLADLLQIEPQEIIAIGDSEIDISMIEYAGLGIAMENARESVLAIADTTTASCEQDGVAKAIKKYIFGEKL